MIFTHKNKLSSKSVTFRVLEKIGSGKNKIFNVPEVVKAGAEICAETQMPLPELHTSL